MERLASTIGVGGVPSATGLTPPNRPAIALTVHPDEHISEIEPPQPLHRSKRGYATERCSFATSTLAPCGLRNRVTRVSAAWSGVNSHGSFRPKSEWLAYPESRPFSVNHFDTSCSLPASMPTRRTLQRKYSNWTKIN